MKKMHALRDIELIRYENVFPNVKKFTCVASTLINLDAAAYIKYSLNYGMCPNVLQTMGTERHLGLVEKANNSEVSNIQCN